MRPTERTIQRLKTHGILCAVVEKWVTIPGRPGGGIRRDLFDCLDCIALLPKLSGGIVGIQCGAMSGHSEHVRKCMASKDLEAWLRSGGRFFIWSWGKRASKKQDGSKGVPRWAVKSQEIALVGVPLRMRLEYEEINPEKPFE